MSIAAQSLPPPAVSASDVVRPVRAVTPLLVIVLIAWLGLAIGAMGLLWKYKNTPGAVGIVHSRWPAGSSLPRSPQLPTLLMFAHPMCPCTRATLTELHVLMTRFAGKLALDIVFIRPDQVDSDWDPEDFRREASQIRGARVIEDPGGHEADRFGALTSGHVVLYAANGELLFTGGITGARGHEGDNAGVDQITRVLQTARPSSLTTPVFGCELHDAR